MLLLDRLEDLELSKVVDKLGQERVLVVVLALLLDIKLNHLLGPLPNSRAGSTFASYTATGAGGGFTAASSAAADGTACFDADKTRYKPPYISHPNPMDLDPNEGTLSTDALTVPAYALAAFMAVVAARKRERMACWSNYPNPSPFWLCLTGFMMA